MRLLLLILVLLALHVRCYPSVPMALQGDIFDASDVVTSGRVIGFTRESILVTGHIRYEYVALVELDRTVKGSASLPDGNLRVSVGGYWRHDEEAQLLTERNLFPPDLAIHGEYLFFLVQAPGLESTYELVAPTALYQKDGATFKSAQGMSLPDPVLEKVERARGSGQNIGTD